MGQLDEDALRRLVGDVEITDEHRRIGEEAGREIADKYRISGNRMMKAGCLITIASFLAIILAVLVL